MTVEIAAYLFILPLFLFGSLNAQDYISCKDDSNNPVDWFYVYKLPKLKADHNNTDLENGEAYAYMTSEDYGQWTLSNLTISDESSIIANTLRPIFTETKGTDFFNILYNDEPPNEPKDFLKGHTKGVVLGNANSGLWLIHSVPQFPVNDGQYSFPGSGKIYGQSFLCLSLDLTNLNEVGLQLQYNEPHIYQAAIPETFRNLTPHLYDAASNVTSAEEPWFRKTRIETRTHNTPFTSFAKAKQFGRDLYSDIVAIELKCDLLTETWLNGRGRLESDCVDLYWVNNIESIRIANVKFKSSEDHSKWAVSNDTAEYWTCVGDINREEHQKFRGGGTVCLENKKIKRAYKGTVVDTERCTNHENEV